MSLQFLLLLAIAFQFLNASTLEGQQPSGDANLKQDSEETEERDFSEFLESMESIKRENFAETVEACSTDDAEECEAAGCFWSEDESQCMAFRQLLEEDPECTVGEQEEFLQCLLTNSCETHQQKRLAKCFDDLKDFYLNPTVKKAFAVADVESSGFLTLPFEVTLFCEAMGVDCPEMVENLVALGERVSQDFLYRYLGYLSTQADDFVSEIEKKAHKNVMRVNDDEKSAWEKYDGPIRKSNVGEECGRSFDQEYGFITRVCSPGLACDTRWKFCCNNPSALQLHTTKDHVQEMEWHYKFSDAGMVMVELNMRPTFEETFQAMMTSEGRRELFISSITNSLGLTNNVHFGVPNFQGMACGACKKLYTYGVGGAGSLVSWAACGTLGTAACTAAGVEGPWFFPFCEFTAIASCRGLIGLAGSYVGEKSGEYMCSLKAVGGHCPRVPGKKYMMNPEGCIPSLQCPHWFMHRASAASHNGNNVHLWTSCGNGNSKWVFEDNQIKLMADKHRCMHKAHGNNFNGNNIHMWDCNGNSNSRFTYNIDEGRIYLVQDPRFTLAKKDGLCSVGNNIHTWESSGNWLNQLWSTPL